MVSVTAVTSAAALGMALGSEYNVEPPQPVALSRYTPTAQELQDSYQRAQKLGLQRGGAYKTQIHPHWFKSNSRFWYRNDLRGGGKEFILVDAEYGVRSLAFDHQKLAAALSKAAATAYAAHKLPFDSIEFAEDGKTICFEVESTVWRCDLTSYLCSREKAATQKAQANSDSLPLDAGRPASRRPRGQRRQAGAPSTSPDGQWTAFTKNDNVLVRSTLSGQETALSHDGNPGLAYGLLQWAPDSRTLVSFRIEPAEEKSVYLIESAPRGGGRAKLHTRAYALPGDRFAAYELDLFSVSDSKQIKPALERIDFGFPEIHWSHDGRHFTYEKVDRGHQRLRLFEVDSHTGAIRCLIDEQSKTFIWTAHAENLRLRLVNYLDRSDEIIYVSERDGWRHMYLIDPSTSGHDCQITSGPYVVRGIDRIDEEGRQIWFTAGGKNPAQDPYFIHHYRVNFDGTGLVALTEGNGNHTIQLSQDRKYLVDTYSRVDLPPTHELRRASDGTLVCKLEDADISELKERGWNSPEVFVAKGRDGVTDIWGIICRPSHFDPSRKYPVIEHIYAGPQGSFVPKSFSAMARFAALAELGFIVVQIDGMGTANRSKAFHDTCWHNLKDAGFPDRILWHQAVARKYPYYDLSRVGIYGASAGGQNSTAALLFHPEFYKVAASACGCHDNRMDKASWNEQWMGYPVGPQYAECSNIDNAYKLQGKLLLIVGEMDNNVPPESTLRLADALIKAGKDFELLVVPGSGHGMGGAYGFRRVQDFFVRHLLGVEPPDRNADSAHAMSKPGNAAVISAVPAVTRPPESFFARVRDNDRDRAREFYSKYIDAGGLPIAASADVEDAALLRTYEIVTHLLAGRHDILKEMVHDGTRLIIIGKDQVYTDMPEYRNHPNPKYQNERVRGTGGLGVTSFGEENLLNLPIDRYDDESIAVHEFCHTIDAALGKIDSTWRDCLVHTYKHAIGQGLWKDTYAGSNPTEYWAEICQSYFDCNRINNWNHTSVATREQLRLYDPDGYELVKTTFKLPADRDWRFVPLRTQPSVIPPPAKFRIDPYYTKFTYAREFIVVGSDHVRAEALLRANDTIRKMFAYRHDVLKVFIAEGARLVILGQREKLSDLPELKNGRNRPDFDQVRYRDYDPALKLMVVPEENVLCLPREPFAGGSSVIGVFARGIYHVAALRPPIADFERQRTRQQYELRVKRIDVEFDQRLQKLYDGAMSKGLWRGTAAARDRIEYWAQGVQAYFDAAEAGPPPEHADRPITNREGLKAYDPGLFALVEETMCYKEHTDWRYQGPAHTP
jgi:dienelactone hydrolase